MLTFYHEQDPYTYYALIIEKNGSDPLQHVTFLRFQKELTETLEKEHAEGYVKKLLRDKHGRAHGFIVHPEYQGKLRSIVTELAEKYGYASERSLC